MIRTPEWAKMWVQLFLKEQMDHSIMAISSLLYWLQSLFFSSAVALQTVCLLAVSKHSSAAIAHNRANMDLKNN